MPFANLDKRLLFLGLIVLLIPVLLFVYLARPAMDKADQAEAQLEQKRKVYSEMMDTAAAKNAGSSAQAKALGKLRMKIPELPYTDRILRDLRLMEVASGLQMRMYNIEPGESAAASEETGSLLPSEIAAYVKPIRISTTMSGSYEQIKRMLEEIETMNRLYQVEQITLNSPAPAIVAVGADQVPVECSLSLVTYYVPELQSIFTTPLESDYDRPSERNQPLF